MPTVIKGSVNYHLVSADFLLFHCSNFLLGFMPTRYPYLPGSALSTTKSPGYILGHCCCSHWAQQMKKQGQTNVLLCSCCIASVVSNSVRPQRQQPTRLPRPWDSPGKNTGVGCHFLLQCMKVERESEASQSCPTLSDPMDCSPPGSSIHGIFQARVLEWGAIALNFLTF